MAFGDISDPNYNTFITMMVPGKQGGATFTAVSSGPSTLMGKYVLQNVSTEWQILNPLSMSRTLSLTCLLSCCHYRHAIFFQATVHY
jgi:hypothetical protein